MILWICLLKINAYSGIGLLNNVHDGITKLYHLQNAPNATVKWHKCLVLRTQAGSFVVAIVDKHCNRLHLNIILQALRLKLLIF